MNITFRSEDEIIYIILEGRIDASNAAVAEEKIFEIKNNFKDKNTVVDADKLDYISSAGLRVILKLRKEDKNLKIINVTPEVYEIFDMTGFTDMVTIEKAYRKISVDHCEFIAKGANGAVYRYDDETIVKTYYALDALPEIQQERENARKAFILGINTAIPYGIVKVGDNYGTVTELLNATSVTKLIRKNLDNLEYPAKYYIDMLKSIHSIEVEDGEVLDMKAIALDWANYVAPHLPQEQATKLISLINEVPKRNTLMHGDYHTNNIMVQNGEPILIDMDTLCMGHPIFELGSMFNAFVGFSEIRPETSMDFFGYDFDTAIKFWDLSLEMYLGTCDKEFINAVKEKAMVVGYTRMLRRAIRRNQDADSPIKIARCKEMLAILLNKVDSLDF